MYDIVTPTMANEEEEDYSFDNFDHNKEDDDEMDEETCLLIKVSRSEVMEWFKPQKKSLVIKLIVKNQGFHIVIEHTKNIWRVKGELMTTDIRNGYIVVRFQNEFDYETAVFGSPWLIIYHYLLVQKYTPFFDPEINKIKKMPFWIRVPWHPPYYFNKEFLSRIGNCIGKTF